MDNNAVTVREVVMSHWRYTLLLIEYASKQIERNDISTEMIEAISENMRVMVEEFEALS